MNYEQRHAMEVAVLNFLIDTMDEKGWKAIAVDTEGDEWEQTKTKEEVLEHVFSVDMSSVIFRKQLGDKGMTHYAYIVLGNDGYDCIADYSYSPGDDFDAAMEIVNEFANGIEEKWFWSNVNKRSGNGA